MVKRAERVRASGDFARVRATGRTRQSAMLSLAWTANQLNRSRFGFVVSKRVGPAITRNLVKRRLRAITHTRRGAILVGLDIVFTARPSAAQADFATLEREIEQLLHRAHLWQPRTSADASAPISPAEGIR